MALIFGVYARRSRLRDEDVVAALREFSSPPGRQPRLWRSDRVLFAVARQGSEREFDPIVATTDGRALLFGGDLYDCQPAARHLADAGRPLPSVDDSAHWMHSAFGALGEAVLGSVSGTFALAHYDAPHDVLTLANDSFGLHPLFVFESADHVAFCSEYEPLTAMPGFSARLDENAVAEYFVLRAPLGERTFFSGIRNLRPGSVLTAAPAESRQRRYDRLEVAIDRTRSLDELADEGAERLRAAVTERLRSRERARAALTGGMDSRLTMAAMTPEQRKIVEFRTQQRYSRDPDLDPEVAIASRLAVQYGLRHLVKVVFDDRAGPRIVDGSFLNGLRVAANSIARLEGFYGGEFLGGGVFTKFPHLGEDAAWARSRLGEVFGRDFIARVGNPIVSLAEERRQMSAESADLQFYVHFYTRGFFTTFGGGSPFGWVNPYRQVSHRIDSIFRDPALLRFLLTVPPELLRERRLMRRIFTRHFAEFCRVPTTRPGAAAPPFEGPREPVRRRAPAYAGLLESLVADPLTWDRGVYDRPAVERALRQPSHWLVAPFADFESWFRARARG